jgi:hypothetical protein
MIGQLPEVCTKYENTREEKDTMKIPKGSHQASVKTTQATLPLEN